jgi:SAM-dependent methyltransferase
LREILTMSIGTERHPAESAGASGPLRAFLRRLLPPDLRRVVARIGVRLTRRPPIGAVRFGSLRRLEPISSDWGFDRGTPIDRHYIERFLEGEASRIRGRVLEIDTNDYTRRFGGGRVTKSDVLHIAEMGPGITLVGDLTSADHLPSEAFDCIIVTQTLQLIYDVKAAATTIHRLLKPGGTALLTFPGMSPLTRDPDGDWGYYWGFTTLSAERLLSEVFVGGEVEVTSWGSVMTATAFLHGVAAEELRAEELEHRDPSFELLVTVRAVRGGTPKPEGP